MIVLLSQNKKIIKDLTNKKNYPIEAFLESCSTEGTTELTVLA